MPREVPALVVNVAVEDLDVESVMLTVAGLKFAATPLGKPLAESVTTPVKPASGVTVTVYCAAVPGVTAFVDGVALSEISGVEEAGAEATKVK